MLVKPIWDTKKLIVANGLGAGHTMRPDSVPTSEGICMPLVKALLAAPLLCILAACSAASGNSDSANAGGPVTTNGTAVAAAPTTTTTSSANLGMNLASIDYWNGSRPFSNLIYGSAFSMAVPGAAPQDIPAQYFDPSGWVKALPTGYKAIKVLSIPVASADITCTFVGNGTINVIGPVSNVVQGTGKTTFHYTSSYPSVQWATLIFDVDPTNYIKNIDCRETGSSTTTDLDPTFVNAVKGYKIIRFLGWMPSTIDNSGNQAPFPTPTITWATRNKPGYGDYTGHDGVPVEVMVELANQAGVDPWFSLPWNADDDYITQFATYVRDNLAAGRKVYVENSNEVWNWGFNVSHQAANEGAAENLPSSDGGAYQQAMERYAEKTAHVMGIWSTVFAGQTNRLVRVGAFQNASPYWVDHTMAYNNFANSVDAVATAPYWAFMQSDYTGQSLDDIMNTILPAQITQTLGLAAQNKQTATKYGKRYITYEGGQHVVLPNNIPLLTQIEQDSRMYGLYKSYITGWNSQAGGDDLVLTDLAGPINGSGAWGLTGWVGQSVSLSATPKMQAVIEFLGLSTTTASTATYQTCPDGSVILSTSTCPTTSGSTSGSTGSSSGGLKKGKVRTTAVA
jgi:hypothetical protein